MHIKLLTNNLYNVVTGPWPVATAYWPEQSNKIPNTNYNNKHQCDRLSRFRCRRSIEVLPWCAIGRFISRNIGVAGEVGSGLCVDVAFFHGPVKPAALPISAGKARENHGGFPLWFSIGKSPFSIGKSPFSIGKSPRENHRGKCGLSHKRENHGGFQPWFSV